VQWNGIQENVFHKRNKKLSVAEIEETTEDRTIKLLL
jgi:hypothetical protein